MLKLFIEKELKEIIGSPKFILMFSISTIMIVLTFYVGGVNYKNNLAQYESAIIGNLRSMDGVKDWRMVKHNIFLKPTPLSSLVSGISNDIGRNVNMYGRGEIRPHGSKYNENPIFAAFRFLDLNFLFQIVLSLFAILFTYNAVNGEKERGTLRLIFSNPISREKYILGKILGSYIALSLPLLIPILLGCVLLPLLGIELIIDEWIRLSLIIAAGFLFVGVFIALSVFVSAISTKSSNSFLLLLIIWILVVLVIPRASVLISGRLVDVPPMDEINSKKNSYNRQLSQTVLNKMKAFKAEGNDDIFQQFQKYMESINDDRDEKLNEFGAKLDEERQNKQNVQAGLSLTLARISPAADFSLAASSLAGTSLGISQDFFDQAKNYQSIFKKFQQEKSGGSSGGGMTMMMITDGDEEPPNIDPTELPKFTFNQPSLTNAVLASLSDFGLLSTHTILFFFGAYLAFRKFDLR